MTADHSDTIICLKDVSFSYTGTVPAVKEINLEIHRGDYLGIIGPNGGGKSTLVKLILGLLKPEVGEIKIFGEPVTKFSAWNKVGYVAQKATDIDSNFPVSVHEVVAMGRVASRGVFHKYNRKDTKIINESLANVDMQDYANTLIGDLSGGQQQRVFIARALAAQPKIIFLDEPTSGVDQVSQDQFYKLLKKLNQDLGITLVLISHDIDVVTREVTEVAAINKKIMYYGLAKSFTKDEHHDKLYIKGMKYVEHH